MATTLSHLHTVADRDGAAILDTENGLISTLNETGAFVWERHQRGQSISAIASELANATGVEITTVNRDVHAFLETLNQTHLLQNARGAEL